MVVCDIPFEALDDNLLDIHLGNTRATRGSQGTTHSAASAKMSVKGIQLFPDCEGRAILSAKIQP
jgi:hypothetical protein